VTDSRANSSNGNGNGANEAARSGSRGNTPRNGDGARTSDNGYRWGRRVDTGEADERSRQANRRRRDVRTRYLDAPLPEDVAFRPGDAGGDSSILPNRRRRPGGLHDTARILVGGARTFGSGWVKRDDGSALPPPPLTPTAAPAPSQAAPEDEAQPATLAGTPGTEDQDGTTDTDAPRKRRRGRRGGRNRRRPGTTEGLGTDEATSDDSEDSEDDAPEDLDDADVFSDAPVADDDDESDEAGEQDADDDRDDIAVEITLDRATDDDDEHEERPRAARAPRRRAAPAPEPIPDDQLPSEFAALGVTRITLETLARFGFAAPTPIQREAIPALLNNLDVVGIAQTGSGKTIAFGVPMMERLDPDLPEVQGLVLVPTRELAQQVLDVLQELGAPWGLTAVGLLGGHSLRSDFKALEGRPQIVVGTPGRILDHLRRQTVSLRHVTYSVLDEADQMLDIGFLPDIRRILSRTPQRRQTALFSATMPGSIKRLIWQFMTDPETVRVDPESSTVDSVMQIYFEVAQRDKVRGLRELIERELKGRTLIFSNTKRGVDHVARELERDGVRVGALHGDMDQKRRDHVVQDFRNGALDVLIATNVAARGLDIPEITHVVNYDVPQNLEEYVHRIGRTGRAGREGKAITFVCEWDMEAFDEIKKNVGVEITREELDLYGQTA